MENTTQAENTTQIARDAIEGAAQIREAVGPAPAPAGARDHAKEFRYNSKSIFLTYSQCPAPREHIMAKLHAACNLPNKLLKAAVGQETHEDGNFHLHACAWYTKPLRFRGSRHMDIEWEGVTYHPNVKDKQVKSKQKRTKSKRRKSSTNSPKQLIEKIITVTFRKHLIHFINLHTTNPS